MVAIVVLGFVGFVATRPATYHVERSIDVNAPAEVVFAQLDDFRAWAAWSPWEKLDPGMNKTFEGPARTVGSSYAWQGNQEVGKGKMTITEREPSKRVAIRLEFIEPFSSVATTELELASKGEAVEVTWSMEGRNDFLGKLFSSFMNMDSMIGGDYEKGLAALKTIAEAEAAKQKAEAEAARARAEAEAAAQAQASARASAKAANPTPKAPDASPAN